MSGRDGSELSSAPISGKTLRFLQDGTERANILKVDGQKDGEDLKTGAGRRCFKDARFNQKQKVFYVEGNLVKLSTISA